MSPIMQAKKAAEEATEAAQKAVAHGLAVVPQIAAVEVARGAATRLAEHARHVKDVLSPGRLVLKPAVVPAFGIREVAPPRFGTEEFRLAKPQLAVQKVREAEQAAGDLAGRQAVRVREAAKGPEALMAARPGQLNAAEIQIGVQRITASLKAAKLTSEQKPRAGMIMERAGEVRNAVDYEALVRLYARHAQLTGMENAPRAKDAAAATIARAAFNAEYRGDRERADATVSCLQLYLGSKANAERQKAFELANRISTAERPEAYAAAKHEADARNSIRRLERELGVYSKKALEAYRMAASLYEREWLLEGHLASNLALGFSQVQPMEAARRKEIAGSLKFLEEEAARLKTSLNSGNRLAQLGGAATPQAAAAFWKKEQEAQQANITNVKVAGFNSAMDATEKGLRKATPAAAKAEITALAAAARELYEAGVRGRARDGVVLGEAERALCQKAAFGIAAAMDGEAELRRMRIPKGNETADTYRSLALKYSKVREGGIEEKRAAFGEAEKVLPAAIRAGGEAAAQKQFEDAKRNALARLDTMEKKVRAWGMEVLGTRDQEGRAIFRGESWLYEINEARKAVKAAKNLEQLAKVSLDTTEAAQEYGKAKLVKAVEGLRREREDMLHGLDLGLEGLKRYGNTGKRGEIRLAEEDAYNVRLMRQGIDGTRAYILAIKLDDYLTKAREGNLEQSDLDILRAAFDAAKKSYKSHRNNWVFMSDALQRSIVHSSEAARLQGRAEFRVGLLGAAAEFRRAGREANDATALAERGTRMPVELIPPNARRQGDYTIFDRNFPGTGYGTTYVLDTNNRVFASFHYHAEGAKRIYHLSEKRKEGESPDDFVRRQIGRIEQGGLGWHIAEAYMKQGFEGLIQPRGKDKKDLLASDPGLRVSLKWLAEERMGTWRELTRLKTSGDASHGEISSKQTYMDELERNFSLLLRYAAFNDKKVSEDFFSANAGKLRIQIDEAKKTPGQALVQLQKFNMENTSHILHMEEFEKAWELSKTIVILAVSMPFPVAGQVLFGMDIAHQMAAGKADPATIALFTLSAATMGLGKLAQAAERATELAKAGVRATSEGAPILMNAEELARFAGRGGAAAMRASPTIQATLGVLGNAAALGWAGYGAYGAVASLQSLGPDSTVLDYAGATNALLMGAIGMRPSHFGGVFKRRIHTPEDFESAFVREYQRRSLVVERQLAGDAGSFLKDLGAMREQYAGAGTRLPEIVRSAKGGRAFRNSLEAMEANARLIDAIIPGGAEAAPRAGEGARKAPAMPTEAEIKAKREALKRSLVQGKPEQFFGTLESLRKEATKAGSDVPPVVREINGRQITNMYDAMIANYTLYETLLGTVRDNIQLSGTVYEAIERTAVRGSEVKQVDIDWEGTSGVAGRQPELYSSESLGVVVIDKSQTWQLNHMSGENRELGTLGLVVFFRAADRAVKKLGIEGVAMVKTGADDAVVLVSRKGMDKIKKDQHLTTDKAVMDHVAKRIMEEARNTAAKELGLRPDSTAAAAFGNMSALTGVIRRPASGGFDLEGGRTGLKRLADAIGEIESRDSMAKLSKKDPVAAVVVEKFSSELTKYPPVEPKTKLERVEKQHMDAVVTYRLGFEKGNQDALQKLAEAKGKAVTAASENQIGPSVLNLMGSFATDHFMKRYQVALEKAIADRRLTGKVEIYETGPMSFGFRFKENVPNKEALVKGIIQDANENFINKMPKEFGITRISAFQAETVPGAANKITGVQLGAEVNEVVNANASALILTLRDPQAAKVLAAKLRQQGHWETAKAVLEVREKAEWTRGVEDLRHALARNKATREGIDYVFSLYGVPKRAEAARTTTTFSAEARELLRIVEGRLEWVPSKGQEKLAGDLSRRIEETGAKTPEEKLKLAEELVRQNKSPPTGGGGASLGGVKTLRQGEAPAEVKEAIRKSEKERGSVIAGPAEQARMLQQMAKQGPERKAAEAKPAGPAEAAPKAKPKLGAEIAFEPSEAVPGLARPAEVARRAQEAPRAPSHLLEGAAVTLKIDDLMRVKPTDSQERQLVAQRAMEIAADLVSLRAMGPAGARLAQIYTEKINDALKTKTGQMMRDNPLFLFGFQTSARKAVLGELGIRFADLSPELQKPERLGMKNLYEHTSLFDLVIHGELRSNAARIAGIENPTGIKIERTKDGATGAYRVTVEGTVGKETKKTDIYIKQASQEADMLAKRLFKGTEGDIIIPEMDSVRYRLPNGTTMEYGVARDIRSMPEVDVAIPLTGMMGNREMAKFVRERLPEFYEKLGFLMELSRTRGRQDLSSANVWVVKKKDGTLAMGVIDMDMVLVYPKTKLHQITFAGYLLGEQGMTKRVEGAVERVEPGAGHWHAQQLEAGGVLRTAFMSGVERAHAFHREPENMAHFRQEVRAHHGKAVGWGRDPRKVPDHSRKAADGTLITRNTINGVDGIPVITSGPDAGRFRLDAQKALEAHDNQFYKKPAEAFWGPIFQGKVAREKTMAY